MTQPVLDSKLAVSQAVAGKSVTMLGQEVDPRLYLAEIRHMSTLLIHLAMRPGGEALADWAADIQAEAAGYAPSARDRRWRTRPPDSSIVRGHVLSEAHAVLRQRTIEEAADRLAPWLDLVANVPNGPRVWLRNRSTCTPLTNQLVDTATFSWHHIGPRLDGKRICALLRPDDIPQVIDANIYHDFFAEMLSGYESSGRLYASLCLVRAVVPLAHWEQAAIRIGLDPSIGKRTANGASARMRVSASSFTEAVIESSYRLPHGRDFRQREERVRALARDPAEWFERWRSSTVPRRHHTSWPYAIAWMWHEVARGWLNAAPVSCVQTPRGFNARYGVFRNSLSIPAQDALRSLVEDGLQSA